MPEGDMVSVTLEDGAVVELSRAAATDVYDLLWLIAPREGAVTAAAKLHRALREALLAEPVVLDAAESTAFSDARARI